MGRNAAQGGRSQKPTAVLACDLVQPSCQVDTHVFSSAIVDGALRHLDATSRPVELGVGNTQPCRSPKAGTASHLEPSSSHVSCWFESRLTEWEEEEAWSEAG